MKGRERRGGRRREEIKKKKKNEREERESEEEEEIKQIKMGRTKEINGEREKNQNEGK